MAASPLSLRLLTISAIAALTACGEPEPPPAFTEPVPLAKPSGPNSEGPRLNIGPGGQVVLSWMEHLASGGGSLRYSALSAGKWGDARDAVADPDMFVNWADIPSVVPLGDDVWLAQWLTKSADSTYAYDVVVSHSRDGGETWSKPVSVHDDGTPTEHGFVSILPGKESTQLLWLDGRKNVNERTGDAIDTGMTLRAGDIDKDGTVSNKQLVDDLVCDCCRTDIAMTSHGPIVVYRNRTQEEIRDIFVARNIEGQWQTGVPISNDGWKISGCPVNGPAIAAKGDMVAVAWFTAANDLPKVQLKVSADAGASFGEPVLISQNDVMGQVDVEILSDNVVAVSWVEKGSRALANQTDVKLMPVTVRGVKGDDRVVGRSAYSRAVPQMRLVDDELIFVWTDIAEDQTRLATVRMPLQNTDEF